MDDLNDLIWQSGPTKNKGTLNNNAKTTSSMRTNTNSNHGDGDLLDLAIPILPKTTHKLNELDPLQGDETSSTSRPSVASMRNLWEQIGNNNSNNNSNNNNNSSSSNGYNKYQSTINAAKSNRSSSPLPAPHASKPSVTTSTTSNSGHDPFGDLLGLGGASHLGRAASPAANKKAPSLNDL
jgi:hypothetical protein